MGETIEGDWTSYNNGVMYTISGNEVSWRDRWQSDIGYENEMYAQLEVHGNNQCSMVMPGGQIQYGRLTEDGFLVWGQNDQEWTWFRAGKKTPPCLVCRDRNLRVHIFDRESVVEQMEKERVPNAKEHDSELEN